MNTKYVAFVLSMPRNNSWNGKWSGEGQCYAIVKKLTTKKLIERYKSIIEQGAYSYCWEDGWAARISVMELDAQQARKMRKNSKGFCGYDWMVNSIINNGEIIYKRGM